MKSLAHRLGGGCSPAPAELLQLPFATAVLVACQLMTCVAAEMMAGKRTSALRYYETLEDLHILSLVAWNAQHLPLLLADTVGNQRGPAMSVGYLSRHAVVCRMRRLQHTRDH